MRKQLTRISFRMRFSSRCRGWNAENSSLLDGGRGDLELQHEKVRTKAVSGGNAGHSVPECGFEVLKTYQATAHIWDLPR